MNSNPAKSKPRKKQHVLVTAGPTREYIDPVRYLSNESSGRMGFALAQAAVEAGYRTTLVAGPCALETPRGVERIDVVSARDMLAACRGPFVEADALYMAAAVADWRPRRRLGGKWRAKDSGADSTTLELVKNPDVLATLTRKKGARLVCGFALETGSGLRRAQAKRTRKRMDYVVLNDETALNARTTTVTILGADSFERRIERKTKPVVARALIALIASGESAPTNR